MTLENNIIISEKSFIIKRLYGYLENLIDETSIKQNTMLFCIYYFLQIIILCPCPRPSWMASTSSPASFISLMKSSE